MFSSYRWIPAVALLLPAGCTRGSSSPADFTVLDQVTTREEQSVLLSDVAQALVRDPSWVSDADSLLDGAMAEVPVADLGLDDVPITDLVDEDGATLEVRVMMRAPYPGYLLDEEDILVGLDPDRYPLASGQMAVWSLDEAGDPIRGSVDFDQNGISSDRPIFIVTVGETFPAPGSMDALGELALPAEPPPPPTTYYLCLCGVSLSTEKDTSNDEFELYVESALSSTTSPAFPSGTNYKFDGSSHTDAAGSSVAFTDVNNKTYTYCASKTRAGIALKALSTCYTAIMPVEDDTTSGSYVSGTSTSSGTVEYGCASVSGVSYASSSLSYRGPSASGTKTSYQRYSSTSSVDPDDNYGGFFMGFTASTTPTTPTKYTAGSVSLVLNRATSCSTTCSSWSGYATCTY